MKCRASARAFIQTGRASNCAALFFFSFMLSEDHFDMAMGCAWPLVSSVHLNALVLTF